MDAIRCKPHVLRVGIIVEDGASQNNLRRLLQRYSHFSWSWTHTTIHAVINALPPTSADVILITYPFATQMCFGNIRELKTVFPDVRIMLVLSFIAEFDVMEALTAGISGFVFVPVPLKASAKSFATALSNCATSSKSHVKAFGKHGKETGSPNLTKRQNEILVQVAAGKADKEIAAMLGLSVFTVNRHLHNMYKNHDVRNRAQAIGLIK